MVNPWCFADLEWAGNSFGPASWLKKFWKDPLVFFPPHVGFQDAFDVICSEHVSEKSMAVRLEPRLQFEGGLIAATGADETWMNIRSPAGDERHGHRNPKEKWKHVSFRWYVLWYVLMCYLIFTASQLFYHFGVFLYDMLKPTKRSVGWSSKYCPDLHLCHVHSWDPGKARGTNIQPSMSLAWWSWTTPRKLGQAREAWDFCIILNGFRWVYRDNNWISIGIYPLVASLGMQPVWCQQVDRIHANMRKGSLTEAVKDPPVTPVDKTWSKRLAAEKCSAAQPLCSFLISWILSSWLLCFMPIAAIASLCRFLVNSGSRPSSQI